MERSQTYAKFYERVQNLGEAPVETNSMISARRRPRGFI